MNISRFQQSDILVFIAVITTSTKPEIRLQYLQFRKSRFFTDTMRISVMEAQLRMCKIQLNGILNHF